MSELNLKPPLDVSRASRRRATPANSGLAPEKIVELEESLKRTLEASLRGTAGLRKRLVYLNDTLEGVLQEVDTPFPNASNVDVKLQIGTARTMRAIMVRALFSDPERIFVAAVEDDADREEANKVEDAFNWRAVHKNGLVDALKDSIIPIFRDGLAFILGRWERVVEKVFDYRVYLTAPDFQADYPSPEMAGVSEERYIEILMELSREDGAPVEVCFETEIVKKDDAAFEIVTLPRFVWWPLSARRLSECEVYGVRMVESEAALKLKAKRGEYEKAKVEEVLSAGKKGQSEPWQKSRDYIEGLSAVKEDFAEFNNFRVVLTQDLDGDDVPEKYLGVFNLDAGKFLTLDRYKMRHNLDFLVPLRFVGRDDRLLAPSLLYDALDLFQEVNDLHRHRNNSRMITDSPIFMADNELQEEIEDELNNWHPGMVLWVPPQKWDRVKQMDVANRSVSRNDLDEENLVVRYVEFILGPTQGLSGQETKEDPNAPATKHLSKLRQAGYRLDDYIDEFKRSFADLGRLGLALYYQHAGAKVAFMRRDEAGKTVKAETDRSLFGLEGLSLDLNARSVAMSPEFEMERVMALRQEAAVNPILLQRKPEVLGLLWDRFVAASRVQNAEELKLGPAAAVPAPMMPAAPAVPPNGTATPPVLKNLVQSLGAGRLGV